MGISRTLAIAAILALPGVALAQPVDASKTGRKAYGTFKVLDRDRDGGLSLAELRTRGREKGGDTLFALLDADGDGRLDIRELGGNGPALGRFQAYDVNKDGFVVRREFPNFVDPLLVVALDRDGDGVVALNELRPAFASTRVAEAPAKVRQARAAAKRPGYCWVPAFGDDGWGLEAPAWVNCRVGG